MEMYENFVGTLEFVRNKEVSVPRGSTAHHIFDFQSNLS